MQNNCDCVKPRGTDDDGRRAPAIHIPIRLVVALQVRDKAFMKYLFLLPLFISSAFAEVWNAADGRQLEAKGVSWSVQGVRVTAEEMQQLRTRAERGDRDAEFAMGEIYAMGLGVPENMHEARKWYLKAAEKGHPVAQRNVALLFECPGFS